MSRPWRALLHGWRRAVPWKRARLIPEQPPAARAEWAVAGLLALVALSAAGFLAAYALDADTQLLGLCLGCGLAFAAAAVLVVGRRLVPDEEVSEPYPELEHPDEQLEIAQLLEESGSRITRRRLLLAAGGAAGIALGVALLAPAASLGPVFDTDRLRRTPWRGGIRLVDSEGRRLLADEIERDTFYTAFAEGASREELGSPLVVVRLEPARIDLPGDRDGWAPDGILAYSKICTHAACAVSLYRAPLYEPTSARPALICPCHYSTFDPATGGTVLFGPAGRPLPQLPLQIGARGELRAAGGFSGAVGPSWWGVRLR